MRNKIWNNLIILLVLVGGSNFAESQEIKEPVKSEEINIPDPMRLKPNWWKYFEGETLLLNERISSVIARLSKVQQNTPGLKNENNQKLLQTFKINLTTLSNLKEKEILRRLDSPVIKESYSLEEWLKLSTKLKHKKDEVKNIQDEIKRVFDSNKSAERSLDSFMAAYLELEPTDVKRYSKGLEIMVSWVSLAVEKEKNRQRKLSISSLQNEISDMSLELESASKNLQVSPKNFN